MEHDAWFFIGIFVFIFLIWIATGGPVHPIAFTGVKLPQPGVLGGGTYLALPQSNLGIKGTAVCLPGSTYCGTNSDNNSPASTGSTNSESDLTPVPSGVTGVLLTPPSQYRNVVSMTNYVGNASSSDPKTEYVQISVAQNSSSPIDITKWYLASGATGNEELIPKGTTVPASGVVNATDDIILEPGQSAYIISGESPVGASFRENKCIGYFNSFQQFTPSLPDNCPSASDELSAAYGTPYIHDPSCIDYTKTLPRCQTAVTTNSSNLTLTCQDFLENHINYNGCLTYHRADSDFNGNTWYIYLGRKTNMWRSKYEVVELLDNRGKTVASFNY
ncbi:MAG: hypothetical protein RLZZ26_676 [Candidatus Parcubacteria bacterium]|jgi:hypothetical protein